MQTPMPLIRSMLSVPGLRDRFIEKAIDVPADVVLLDLEDSIATSQKAAARERVRAAVPSFDKRGRLLFVRPNALETGLLEADLEAVVGPGLDGIHLPKTHDPGVLQRLDAYLALLERTRGLALGSVRVIAWIESTAGVANAEAICRATPRLLAVSMGAEDYATSLGVMRTRGSVEIEYARARVANAALAAGLPPIDCPEPDYRDLEHFERDITHARALGYRGKYCIHPAQVEIANRVVDAYEAGEREGLGAVGLDGAMIDRPVYVRARGLLERHAAIGARAALTPACARS